MITVTQFCNRHGITLDAEYTDANPSMEDSANMNHWRVTLKRPSPRRQMTLTYSMGYALTGQPEADDVLNCLLSDAAGIENARDFEDWASEYGYDTDSRKAERVYRACQRQTNKLRQFLGNEYEDAVWNLEPM